MEEKISPMKKCPRFSFCSIPKCPLDGDIDLRVKLPGEPDCTLAKSVRMRLGKDLPRKGMTKREFAGWRRWKDGGLPKELVRNFGKVSNLKLGGI